MVVTLINIGPVLDKPLNHLKMTFGHSSMQGNVSIVVTLINIGPVLDKPLNHLKMIFNAARCRGVFHRCHPYQHRPRAGQAIEPPQDDLLTQLCRGVYP